MKTEYRLQISLPTKEEFVGAATELLNCHPHHFEVLADGYTIRGSQMAMECIARWKRTRNQFVECNNCRATCTLESSSTSNNGEDRYCVACISQWPALITGEWRPGP
jgi:hypothetical protein